jgi:hypothetical protein
MRGPAYKTTRVSYQMGYTFSSPVTQAAIAQVAHALGNRVQDDPGSYNRICYTACSQKKMRI